METLWKFNFPAKIARNSYLRKHDKDPFKSFLLDESLTCPRPLGGKAWYQSILFKSESFIGFNAKQIMVTKKWGWVTYPNVTLFRFPFLSMHRTTISGRASSWFPVSFHPFSTSFSFHARASLPLTSFVSREWANFVSFSFFPFFFFCFPFPFVSLEISPVLHSTLKNPVFLFFY